MSLFKRIEQNIQQIAASGIEHLEEIYGRDLKLYKPTNCVHTDVYGTSAGQVSNEYIEIRGVTTGDDFFASDGLSSGAFQEGFLFTSSKNVDAGDTLEFDAEDGVCRRYKVIEQQDIGQTTKVFTRWRLSAIGD